MKSTESKDSDWPILVGFIVICIGISLVWYLTPNLAKYLLEIKSTVSCENTGVFGDTFGMTNTLFSGLAFAALITALLLQKKELSLQRQELKHTQEIMNEQREQLEKQAESLEKQNFESTFLQLLKLLREVRDSAIHRFGRSTTDTGELAINIMASNLRDIMTHGSNDDLSTKYAKFYARHIMFVRPFIGIVSEILQFIENAKIDDKKVYFRLVRTLISAGELDMIFYHQLSSNQVPGLTPIIENYGLFAYISEWVSRDDGNYQPSAFEDRLSYDT